MRSKTLKVTIFSSTRRVPTQKTWLGYSPKRAQANSRTSKRRRKARKEKLKARKQQMKSFD
jgi:hypothetical protein